MTEQEIRALHGCEVVELGPPVEGLRWFKGQNGKFGFINDETGAIEHVAEFDWAGNFCQGRAQVKKGGTFSSLNRSWSSPRRDKLPYFVS